MKRPKALKKKVSKHLKEDVKEAKESIKEDKMLIKKMKNGKKSKSC